MWFPVQVVGDVNAKVLGLVDIFQRVASQSIGRLMRFAFPGDGDGLAFFLVKCHSLLLSLC